MGNSLASCPSPLLNMKPAVTLAWHKDWKQRDRTVSMVAPWMKHFPMIRICCIYAICYICLWSPGCLQSANHSLGLLHGYKCPHWPGSKPLCTDGSVLLNGFPVNQGGVYSNTTLAPVLPPSEIYSLCVTNTPKRWRHNPQITKQPVFQDLQKEFLLWHWNTLAQAQPSKEHTDHTHPPLVPLFYSANRCDLSWACHFLCTPNNTWIAVN